MSREPSHLEDAVWGSLRVTRDPEDGYYLETEITVGPKGREITLSFTCPERSLSGEQQNLAESIVNSTEEALISAATLYSLTYGSDLLAEYGVEMVSLPEQGDTWELWLTRKHGFENCVVDFVRLDAKEIRFSA